MRAAADGGWLLELNPETLPRVLVNQHFFARIAPRAGKEGRKSSSPSIWRARTGW